MRGGLALRVSFAQLGYTESEAPYEPMGFIELSTEVFLTCQESSAICCAYGLLRRSLIQLPNRSWYQSEAEARICILIFELVGFCRVLCGDKAEGEKFPLANILISCVRICGRGSLFVGFCFHRCLFSGITSFLRALIKPKRFMLPDGVGASKFTFLTGNRPKMSTATADFG